MKKFLRKQQLSKIQLMERENRKHRRIMMRGLPTRPGTPNRIYRPVAEPSWRPISSPVGMTLARNPLETLLHLPLLLRQGILYRRRNQENQETEKLIALNNALKEKGLTNEIRYNAKESKEPWELVGLDGKVLFRRTTAEEIAKLIP